MYQDAAIFRHTKFLPCTERLIGVFMRTVQQGWLVISLLRLTWLLYSRRNLYTLYTLCRNPFSPNPVNAKATIYDRCPLSSQLVVLS